MKQPNFFIVGAPKCGTTALSEYLRTHPQVFMTTPKEPHYFAQDFPHYMEKIPTLEHYLALFEEAGLENTAVGEASVWYLYSDVALRNIRAFNPNARIVVMLRDPVELAQSIHSQLVWVLDEDVTDFAAAWALQARRQRGEAIPESCREPAFLQYGAVAMLGRQIDRLFSIFPPEQVKVILLDDLKQDPRGVYLSTLSFLDLADDGRMEFPVINDNKYNRFPAVARFAHRPPQPLVSLLETTKKALGIRRLGLMRHLLNHSSEKRRRPNIPSELRRELADYFKSDLNQLADLIRRDISHWGYASATVSEQSGNETRKSSAQLGQIEPTPAHKARED